MVLVVCCVHERHICTAYISGICECGDAGRLAFLCATQKTQTTKRDERPPHGRALRAVVSGSRIRRRYTLHLMMMMN